MKGAAIGAVLSLISLPIHALLDDERSIELAIALAKGKPFAVASDLALTPADANEVFAEAENGVARYGSTDEFFVIGDKMNLDEAAASLLTDAVPAVLHLPGHSERAQTVQWLLGRLVGEVDAGGPGSDAMAAHVDAYDVYRTDARASCTLGSPDVRLDLRTG
ncbi:MAG: cupin domain-containing protein [Gammaproteobacteria bacterium]